MSVEVKVIDNETTALAKIPRAPRKPRREFASLGINVVKWVNEIGETWTCEQVFNASKDITKGNVAKSLAIRWLRRALTAAKNNAGNYLASQELKELIDRTAGKVVARSEVMHTHLAIDTSVYTPEELGMLIELLRKGSPGIGETIQAQALPEHI